MRALTIFATGVLSVLLSGCGSTTAPTLTSPLTQAAPTTVTTSALPAPALSQVARPVNTAQHVAALKAKPIPPLPAKSSWPESDTGCAKTIVDAAPRRVVMSDAFTSAVVETKSKPWAFVKGDVDANGNYINLRIVKSSGVEAFDEVAVASVKTWRVKLPPGSTGFSGCIAPVMIA